jgi:hypothetical protein
MVGMPQFSIDGFLLTSASTMRNVENSLKEIAPRIRGVETGVEKVEVEGEARMTARR